MSAARHSGDPDEPLRLSKDKQANFKWPMAIDARLDALVSRAVDAGANANRRELAAALVLNCDLSGKQLSRLLSAYRTSVVKSAELESDPSDGTAKR